MTVSVTLVENMCVCVCVCVRAHILIWASLIAQLLKNLPAMQETVVRYLGQEDALERGMATYSSILAFSLCPSR